MPSALLRRDLLALAMAASLSVSPRSSEPGQSLQLSPHANGSVIDPPSYSLKTWQTDDGLPQMTPTAITQTRDGYLWVGTFNGISRFDGVRFTSFFASNTPELASDHVTQLFEDTAGTLWIGTTEGGLVRYRNGAFTAVHDPQNISSLTIHSICEDRSGTIWVGTSKGLCRVAGDQLKPSPVFQAPVVSVLRGVGDELWIGTHTDIRRIKSGGEAEAPITSSKRVRLWIMDAEGKIWASFVEGGLGMISSGAPGMQWPQPPARFKVDSFHLGNDRRLRMGTLSGGLMELAPEKTNLFVGAGQFNAGITAVYRDKDDNVWLGLEAQGLWRLNKSRLVSLGVEHGLPPARVTSICQETEGRIWVGTWGGSLQLWNGNQFEPIKTPLLPGQISSILPARNGPLWFATYGGKLARRMKNGGFEYEDTFGRHTRTLFQDRDGGIWSGRFLDGLYHRSAEGKTRSYRESDGLSNEAIHAIAQDHAGDMWIGTARGLNRIHNGKIEKFFRKDGLAGDTVRALFVDSQGSVWIGSADGGLSRWKDGQLQFIGVEQGLINNGIEQIIEDDHGYIWLGSNAGLMRVEMRQLNECLSRRSSYIHSMVFRREEGTLPGFGSGFQPSCFKAPDGKLWFAAAAGVVVIDPAKISSGSTPPPVYVEELRADKNAWTISSDTGREAIIVPPGTRRLEFQYTGLDFESPALIRFRHKLEGFEEEWVNSGSRREAVYTRVPPGQYRFRVSAANNHGVWNETGAAVSFAVQPFFWQTRAFQVAAAIGGLGTSAALAWGFVSRRHRRELERLEQERQLERERARIAQDMHDGLGASLVKISLLGERVERCLNQPEQAQAQLQKITATARHAMTEMDEIVWAVNPRNDTLENFAGYLCQFAREHFNDTDVACHVDVPPQLPNTPLGSEIRHNLLLAVREVLNNTLKHSRGTQVRIAMGYAHPLVTIHIEDDGIGFDKTPKPGNGLGNIRRRIEGLGGEVNFESPAQGTSVRLSLNIDPQRRDTTSSCD